MLEAINLSKHYNGTVALDSLNLKIEPGEVFCLLGANGAGKTTTINLFLNFIEPTSGAATIKGLDVTMDKLVRLRPAQQFHTPHAICHISYFISHMAYGMCALLYIALKSEV
jgi:ABC-type multidrug transport system ATPase subunit